MTNPADYANRTVDLQVLQGIQRYGKVLTPTALAAAGEGGRAATGIVKLAQRFLLELLTPRGSQIYNPTRGSSLLPEIQEGRIRTPIAASTAGSRAILTAKRSLLAEESSTDPDDERYGSARVRSAEVTSNSVIYAFELTSRAAAATVILPLNIGTTRLS